MKAKELIKELQKLVEENGDCDVFVTHWDDDDGSSLSLEADNVYLIDYDDSDDENVIEISNSM